MSDLAKPAYVTLITGIEKIRSAHIAVSEGIATEVEKHHVARAARLGKMKQERALKPGTAVGNGQL